MTDEMGIIPEEEIDEELGGLDIVEEEIGDDTDDVLPEEVVEITDEEEELCDIEEHGHAEHPIAKRLCHDCIAEMEDEDDDVDYFGDEDDEARYYRASADEESEEF